MRKGTTACEGRAFHPSCLGRDPAGAIANGYYSSDKKNESHTPRDLSHKLCGGCLDAWQEGGGQIGKLAMKREIIVLPVLTHYDLDCDTRPTFGIVAQQISSLCCISYSIPASLLCFVALSAATCHSQVTQHKQGHATLNQ